MLSVAAATLPKLTAVTPVKLAPVIVTTVPPGGGPLFGATELTAGAPMYVNWSAELVVLVPPGVVTVTSARPVPAGLVAVILVSVLKVKVAAVGPKLTALAPVKLVPVMTTEV